MESSESLAESREYLAALPTVLGFVETPHMQELRAVYSQAIQVGQPSIVDKLYGEYMAMLRGLLQDESETDITKNKIKMKLGSLIVQAEMLKEAGEQNDYVEVLESARDAAGLAGEDRVADFIKRLISSETLPLSDNKERPKNVAGIRLRYSAACMAGVLLNKPAYGEYFHRELDLSYSAIYAILKKWEKEGFIKSHPTPDNHEKRGAAKWYELTDEGKAALEPAYKVWTDRLRLK